MQPRQSVGKGKDKTMTRNEVKELMKSWGIEEPTDEQVTDYLNRIQKEVKTAEDKANRYKADADKVRDLEKQIEEMNNANLTDLEKANKATEDAMNKVASLEKTVRQMEQLKALADIGIVGDDANGLVNEDGSLNTEKLGEIISAREKSAVATYQKQSLENTPAPDDKKPEEEDKPGKDIVERVTASKKAEAEAVNIIDAYK
jgi:hypothetical protein